MKVLAITGLSLLILTAVDALASGGCGGYSRYETVKYLGQEALTGEFSCREVGVSYYYCSFRSKEQQPQYFGAMSRFLPPTGRTLEIGVDVFEAIAVEDCDGSEVRGILKRFLFAGALFQTFKLSTALPATNTP